MTNFVPNGLAHIPTIQLQETQMFSFMLLHNFSMLAFSAAIEPLRIANQLSGKELFHWETLSLDGEGVRSSNGVFLNVDRAAGITQASTIVLVCGGVEPEKSGARRVSEWLRAQWRTGRTVGALCTGAYALAYAGLLQGRSFTLHWENLDVFRESFPLLDPVEQLFVKDGRLLTCAGGSAATDMIISIVYERHGAELSNNIINMCLHQSARPASGNQRCATSAMLGTRHPKLALIVNFMHSELEQDLSMVDIAEEFDISQRQIERLFKTHLCTTPKEYLQRIRLERGRALLAETNLRLAEVSAACGFGSSSHFAKRFAKRYGFSPSRYAVSRAKVV